MKVSPLVFLGVSLLFSSLDAAPIKNQKLLKQLKSSQRWLLLPLVEESEQGGKLSADATNWIYEKETELQDLDLEIVTLSQKEQKQANAWWTQPFTTRLNKKLIEFCQSLNCNLLTAYHNPKDPHSFTYVVYSQDKKRQLIFRSPKTHKDITTQPKEVKPTPKVAEVKSKKTPTPEPKAAPAPVKTSLKTEHASSNFSEQIQSWFSVKERPERTRISEDNRRRRKSEHPEVKQQRQTELHDILMKNKDLVTYAKTQSDKGQAAIESSCLEHLKQAEESWMSSTKYEHLSRAYVLNQHLKTPNKELKEHLISELSERQEFLNSWDSDVSR